MPVFLGPRVADTLSTSDLLNGDFFDSRSQRITVFAANWGIGQGSINSVVHNPENCWIFNGFKVISCGEPSQVEILIAGQRIPFQCRVFKHPERPTLEITLWAACIEGRWAEVPKSIPIEKKIYDDSPWGYIQELGDTVARRFASVCLLIRYPSASTGRKQFVRLSKPITTEWKPALAELEAFAHQWLALN